MISSWKEPDRYTIHPAPVQGCTPAALLRPVYQQISQTGRTVGEPTSCRSGQRRLLPSAASFPATLLMCDKEAIEVQKILPFLSDTWPLCRIGRAVIRASQSCRQSCNKSQCPACGCRSHHSCTHAPQFSRSFPAREWGSVLQRQGACGQCP